MQVVRVHEQGGPEVVRLDELPTPSPGRGEALVRVAASGVNFIDIYHRSGQYKVALPFALGQEGAGTIESLGDGVEGLSPGQHVAWSSVGGSHASHALVPAARLVPVPDGVSLQDAAAAMLQGMTAHYLTHSTYPLAETTTCLIHAAAGGVGQLFCQMARLRGAKLIIGTAGSAEKAELARAAGAHEVILYREQSFLDEVKRMTGGAGLDVVYDSVGRDTFDDSLSALKPRGTMVLFGASSGAVPPFDINVLQNKGSLHLTRPTLAHYTATREELLWRSGDLFTWLRESKLKLRIERTYPLAQAAQAQIDLASRTTAGKLLLIP